MSRSTCEESKRLDAAEFARQGWLRPNLPGTSSWTRGNQPSGSISWHSYGSRLELSYTITDWRGEKHDYRYSVPVERTATAFGGQRTWWRCPNTRCGRRVQLLYQPPGGRHFLCRRCHDLAYRSQQDRQAPYWRHVDKIRALEERLEHEDLAPRERRRLMRTLWRLSDVEWELPTHPLRGIMAELWERDPDALVHNRRAEAQKMLPRRPAGRPSKAALRERARLLRLGERWLEQEESPPKEKRPPGRPKEKRDYSRRAPFVLATPPSPNVAYCVRCRDRRPLTYRRIVKLSNGRRAMQGRCTECGIKTRRLLPAAPLVA
ncbi:MAG: hypothetical protein AVDCRST_MAG77-4831 [uncultured Chloroflexi bacterium]|uniref:Uncharacterized protein n=1 Tax=uncultured Chloroflexota bacterium TaxID=166587 RepID=A0A6J4K0I5_9CHLR|nr:MAG: hypothetical protein AVDCRST_MAG77-4831 [uncultured Chloroflexota bacterium]